MSVARTAARLNHSVRPPAIPPTPSDLALAQIAEPAETSSTRASLGTPGTSQPIRRSEARRRSQGRPPDTIERLPADLHQMVDRMLIEGAAFREVVEAVKTLAPEPVTVQALERYFRSSVPLQKQRIEWQLSTVRELKKSLGNSETGELELLDAIILTGLTCANRKGIQLALKDAFKQRAIRETLQLRKQDVQMKNRKLEEEVRLLRARARAENEKARLLETKVRELHQRLGKVKKTGRLDPETFRKIEEIYGIVETPVVIDGTSETETREA